MKKTQVLVNLLTFAFYLIIRIGAVEAAESLGGGGSEGGNGGDVVVCQDRTMVLDVYEAESLRSQKLDLGAEGLSIEDKIRLATKRLWKVDPYRAGIIRELALNFVKESKFLRGIDLKDVDDSNEIFLPRGCELKQIAVQGKRILPSDPYYVVNQDLWDQLNTDNKAVLALHEAIFRATSSNWSSSLVRLLNSMTFTTTVDLISKSQYYQMVHGTPLKDTVYAGTVELWNGGWGIGPRWIFQLPDYRPNVVAFQKPSIWSKKEIRLHWSHECQRMGGSPVQAGPVDGGIGQIFRDYDWGNPPGPQHTRRFFNSEYGIRLFEIDSGSMLPRSVYGNDGITPEDATGEVWCESNNPPVNFGFYPFNEK